MSCSKLRVLIVPSWYPMAPAPSYGVFFREQAQALARAGLGVSAVFPEMLPVLRASEFNVARDVLRGSWETDEDGVLTRRVRSFAPDRWPTVRAWYWTAACEALILRHCARHGSPDLIHAHGAAWPFSAGALSARAAAAVLRVPYVVTEHASVFLENRPFPYVQAVRIRQGLASAARVVAVSRALAARLRQWVDEDRLEVVGNLVDSRFFTIPDMRPQNPTILCVAGLVPNKDVAGLLRGYAAAFPDEASPVLEIGGDGPERASLETEVTRLGLSGRVRFLGHLDRNGVRDALWRCGLFVLNSHLETFGVALVEALATGVPVVATRCGGPEDVVGEADGLLVPHGNPKVLARTLRTAWQARDRFDPVGLRERAVTRFGDRAICNRLISLYENVLAGRAR